jgi:peptide deformylase
MLFSIGIIVKTEHGSLSSQTIKENHMSIPEIVSGSLRRRIRLAPCKELDTPCHGTVNQRDIDNLFASIGKNGIGLAANQIGLTSRVFIGRINGVMSVFIEPLILTKSGLLISHEGCLSIPGVFLNINRARVIKLEHGPEGGRVSKVYTGNDAAIIQHEIDHLNGVLFTRRFAEQYECYI